MQKHVNLVNLVDLVKSFTTNILLQNLASIQKRRSPTEFDHLAEKRSPIEFDHLRESPARRDPSGYACQKF